MARIRKNHEQALRKQGDPAEAAKSEGILMEKEGGPGPAEVTGRGSKAAPVYSTLNTIGAIDREPADAAIREKREKIKEVSAPS